MKFSPGRSTRVAPPLHLPGLEHLETTEDGVAALDDSSLRSLRSLAVFVERDEELRLLERIEAGYTLRELRVLHTCWAFGADQIVERGHHAALEVLEVACIKLHLAGIERFRRLRRLRLSCGQAPTPCPTSPEELRQLAELPMLEELELDISGDQTRSFHCDLRTKEAVASYIGSLE